MKETNLQFSDIAKAELKEMGDKVLRMFDLAMGIFDDTDKSRLLELTAMENEVDNMKRTLPANHFARLAEGQCTMEVSAYYLSAIAGIERVADHLINVGYSIVNPTGSQSEARQDNVLAMANN